jgi:hypothetical protein
MGKFAGLKERSGIVVVDVLFMGKWRALVY